MALKCMDGRVVKLKSRCETSLKTVGICIREGRAVPAGEDTDGVEGKQKHETLILPALP